MHYENDKKLTESRRREERRQLVICTAILAAGAGALFTLAYFGRSGPEGGLLAALGCLYLLGAVWCGLVVWIELEDGP